MAAAAWGQTKVTPAQINGTGAPAANCVVGQRYFRTDATAGQNDYLCTATNTWTLANVDAVLGASSLTLAQAVPFVTSSGVLTDDPYFTYTPIPGSPVAGTTLYRNSISRSAAPSSTYSYWDDDTQAELSVRGKITALSISDSDNYGQVVGVLVDTEIAPSIDWHLTPEVNSYGVVSNIFSSSASSMGSLSGGYFSAQNFSSGANLGNVTGLEVRGGSTGSGAITNVRGVVGSADTDSAAGSVYNLHGVASYLTGNNSIENSIMFNGNTYTVQGTTVNAYGMRLTQTTSGTITNTWGISDETGWPSRLLGKVAIGPSNSAAPTDTLYVKDATASTGATSVSIGIGAGQSSTSTVLTLAGVVRFNGQNTTGAGSAALGANSPAVTNTAPYTWIRAVSSDGSTIYIPAWK